VLAFAHAADPRGDAPNARLRPPAEEKALFHLPPGFEIQLVAAEPEIQKPMNVAFDAAGRVWVTGSTLYPWPARRDAVGEPIAAFQKNWDDNTLAFRASSTPPEPAERGLDTVRVLADFDPVTGRARKVTVFADGLNIPIGVLPLPCAAGAKGDSVLVFSIPAIWRLTDTDGDGRADRREKLYDGFGFKDTHGMSSNYWQWLDGWVYGTHGFANPSEVVDRAGRVVKLTSGNTYRFRPDGSRFEVFVHGQTNPFGLAFDARGDLYTADSHSKPVYLLIPGGYYEGISKEHDGLGFAPAITTDDHGSSAIAGLAHYSAAHFPPEFRDNLFNGNPVTRRINRTRLEWRGSTPAAARQTDFLTSDDPAFRPVQVKLGPDGALWIADFYNPIIGHYEVPLTHPARDRAHGRLWRIVWRGLDGTAPRAELPNLAQLTTADLVPRLSDTNLVVRSLAAAELVARADAAASVPALTVAAKRLIAGADPTADGTAALAIFLTLERLGAADAALLRSALARPESEVAVAALRAYLLRPTLAAGEREWWAKTIMQTANFSLWRQGAALFAADPQPWKAEVLLTMLLAAPSYDTELTYAVRLALKVHLATATAAEMVALADSVAQGSAKEAHRLVAEVSLAVRTPAAAQFLLGHLQRTQMADARAAELARHAVQNLPVAELPAILPLLGSLEKAPRGQRLTLAEGLASVAARAEAVLPATIDAWLRGELLAAIEESDAALALRSVNAVKPLAWPEKTVPLRRVALDAKARENVRTAAVRALDPAATETVETWIAVLTQSAASAQTLRRAAAELLGVFSPKAEVRAALVGALPGASADLALTVVTALAKSDAGAAELLELAAAGRVRAAWLRHRYVALALEKRPAELRERVAVLTQSLPPEDARLDALVAYRVGALAGFKADRGRGAALFTANCAACHRLRDAGGNLGPSLDGLGARALPRLVEDILDPNRNVDPTFRLTTVTLKNGETKTGMDFRAEADHVRWRDAGTGAEIVVAKGDVAASVPSATSPMPAAFETGLSEQDFFDLVHYLRSPGS
jgi:putative heme-binding domain-containing protein